MQCNIQLTNITRDFPLLRNRPTWSARVRRRWSRACNHLILILLPLPHQPLHREGGGARGRCLCCPRRKTSSMATTWAIAVWALFLLATSRALISLSKASQASCIHSSDDLCSAAQPLLVLELVLW